MAVVTEPSTRDVVTDKGKLLETPELDLHANIESDCHVETGEIDEPA